MFDKPVGEVHSLVRSAVMQRAVELQELRDRNLAVRIANGVNGARSIDGQSSGTTTSTGG